MSVKEKVKVIFLDVDGVLNSTEDWIEMRVFGHKYNHGSEVMSATKLAMLQNILDKTGAKIVLSSTWRLNFSLVEFHSLLTKRGCRIPLETLIGRTPRKMGNGFRGQEILWWLEGIEEEGKYEVDRYVILDDSSGMFTEQIPFHVHTSEATGMSVTNMELTIQMLNRTEEELEKIRKELLETAINKWDSQIEDVSPGVVEAMIQ